MLKKNHSTVVITDCTVTFRGKVHHSVHTMSLNAIILLNIVTRKKDRNVGQRWLVRRINVEMEKHTGGQAAGLAPASGEGETGGGL